MKEPNFPLKGVVIIKDFVINESTHINSDKSFFYSSS